MSIPEIIVTEDQVEIIETAEQGPPGPAGSAGDTFGVSPMMTYDTGRLTRVDYSNGAYKTFSYTGGKLTQVHLVKDGITLVREFSYSPDGSLAGVTETVQ